MMVVFPPVFVANTKIIFGYNFGALLKLLAVKALNPPPPN